MNESKMEITAKAIPINALAGSTIKILRINTALSKVSFCFKIDVTRIANEVMYPMPV